MANDQEATYFELVREMEARVSRGVWDEVDQYFDAELRYTVGHLPVRTGVSGLKAHMDWQNPLVRWDGHEMHLFTRKDNALIVEVTSLFHRYEDKTDIRLPCTDIYRFDDENRIYDWRVYADITPFKTRW